jgi:hypothetical protein
MYFELIDVTPEIAAKFLMKNEGNRKLREKHAASLARAMESGNYKLTHQAAAVTKKGKLIDGQHRMRAVMMSGKTVQMWIARDVPDDTFAVLDAGMIRTMHERLRSDPKHTSLCTSMYRLMVTNRKAQDYEIQLLLELFEDSLNKWSEVPKLQGTKGFTIAHSAALVIRLEKAIRAKDPDAVMRLQWKAEKVVRGDLVGAPPILNSFYRQMMEGVANLDLGVAAITDQFCRSWVAFDAESEGTTRLQISDHSVQVREARTTFKEITEGVFDQ